MGGSPRKGGPAQHASAHLLLHRGEIVRCQRGRLGEVDLPVLTGGEHPFDHAAVEVGSRATFTANSTEGEAARAAILEIKGYQGVERNFSFDKNGDGLYGYNVVRNDNGKITFVKRVDPPPE